LEEYPVISLLLWRFFLPSLSRVLLDNGRRVGPDGIRIFGPLVGDLFGVFGYILWKILGLFRLALLRVFFHYATIALI
ncbi:GM16398, partial [Drosophila sechellia]